MITLYSLPAVVFCLLLAVGCAGMEAPTPMDYKTPTPDPVDSLVTEEGSDIYMSGMELFRANCAVCHGDKGTGSDTGPPLIHEYYHPYHHPDFAFHAAVMSGVSRHHWEYGDMPPVSGLNEDDVEKIICYVRSLQQDSGMPVISPC